MLSKGGVGRGRAPSQTPSEQVISVAGYPGTINCMPKAAPAPPPAPRTLCQDIFEKHSAGKDGRGGGGRNGAGINSGRGGGGGGGGSMPHGGGAIRHNDTFVCGALRIVQGLNELWHEQKLCDVVLHAADADLRAHKAVLAAYSTFLVERFSHFPAGDVVSIDLNEFSCEIVHTVLQYVYTGELEIIDETAGPILKCADELGICEIVQECLSHLSNVTHETAILFYSVADNHGIDELKDGHMQYISEHFREIALTKHFLYLPYERLMCILSSDLLNIDCEIEVFCAVVAWIDYDRANRLCYAPSLLKCAVRMHCISPEQLIMKCETIDWLFENPDCEYILNEAIRFDRYNAILMIEDVR